MYGVWDNHVSAGSGTAMPTKAAGTATKGIAPGVAGAGLRPVWRGLRRRLAGAAGWRGGLQFDVNRAWIERRFHHARRIFAAARDELRLHEAHGNRLRQIAVERVGHREIVGARNGDGAGGAAG